MIALGPVPARAGPNGQDKPAAPADQTAPSASALKPGYAGSEACAACHEDKVPAALAHHKALETSKRHHWAGMACEACHGPGKDHAESGDITKIVSFKSLSSTKVIQVCLGCHANAQRISGRRTDPHSRNEMSCTSCHVIHRPVAEPLLVKASTDLCFTCHTDVKGEFTRPYRHRLQEGMVTCVDCHNPHGTVRNAALKSFSANEPGCLKCHGDKRGPFVFEHAPMDLKGCTECHEPHGSVNPRMLVRADVKSLCLECHTLTPKVIGGPPPAFHDVSTPRFQNCTTCHVKVHGSNVDREFLR